MAINRELLKELKKTHNPEVFFETGFYHGHSTEYALEEGFEKVYSIELLKRFVDHGNEKFEKEISEGRVNIIFDDSANLKNHVSDLQNKKVLFWLDAHLDNGRQGAVKQPEFICPAIREIEALTDFKVKPIILVDDISIIRGNGIHTLAWGDQGISVERITEAINNLPFEYEITFFENAGVKDDILVAV